ncbi:phytanoyl-CoA dioxygenase family protein [Alphaproteobacteria bacterium]|nr:phytanoyl-CoA dioxygenase family protein [Alphaproteobacteria bacterium]
MSAVIGGKKVPDNLLGKLKETNLNNAEDTDLRNALEKDGYLFLRNVIENDQITEARKDIFNKLGEVEEIQYPYVDGISSGKSKRDMMFSNRGEFWEEVSNLQSLRNVTNGQNLKSVFDKIFGTPAVGFDFIFLRAVAGGKFTHMHCDSGFFTRKTEKVLTCWLVLTDVTLEKGPLFIIKDSHKFKDIYEKYKGFDVDIHKNIKATIDTHPVDFAKERNTKILTAEFKPGDTLIFGMYTVHGTFENHTKDNKIRLTCDIRFQPINEPKDPRYFGPRPGGTTGGGYGELNSARPLNEDWHIR